MEISDSARGNTSWEPCSHRWAMIGFLVVWPFNQSQIFQIFPTRKMMTLITGIDCWIDIFGTPGETKVMPLPLATIQVHNMPCGELPKGAWRACLACWRQHVSARSVAAQCHQAKVEILMFSCCLVWSLFIPIKMYHVN